MLALSDGFFALRVSWGPSLSTPLSVNVRGRLGIESRDAKLRLRQRALDHCYAAPAHLLRTQRANSPKSIATTDPAGRRRKWRTSLAS